MLDYQHWTPEETDTLERAVYTGKTARETAARIGRTRSAVHSKAHALGRPFDPESRDLSWYAINRAIERDQRAVRQTETLREFIPAGRIAGLVDQDEGIGTWAVVSHGISAGNDIKTVLISLPALSILDEPS